jgi:hypothetical protein
MMSRTRFTRAVASGPGSFLLMNANVDTRPLLTAITKAIVTFNAGVIKDSCLSFWKSYGATV